MLRLLARISFWGPLGASELVDALAWLLRRVVMLVALPLCPTVLVVCQRMVYLAPSELVQFSWTEVSLAPSELACPCLAPSEVLASAAAIFQ